MSGLSRIDHQIMWNRLIAVVEEQAQALLRTAFSTIVRECGDLSAGVFDTQGRMLAQAVTGTPGHVNSMAESVKHFLHAFPVETMAEGDVYITNDPWKGTGHLNDFVVTTPCFLKGKLVGAFLLHLASHRHRRHRLRAGRHRRPHGGHFSPLPQDHRQGAAEPGDPRHLQGQLAPAGGDGGRHLLAHQLQRCRLSAARRDDGGVFPRRAWTGWPRTSSRARARRCWRGCAISGRAASAMP